MGDVTVVRSASDAATAPTDGPAPARGTGASPGGERVSRRRSARLVRSVLAVGAGLLLSVAFPPHDLWLLAPLAVALLAMLVRGRRLRAAYGLGFLFGLGFLVPLLAWSRVAGSDGWLVLSLLQALFVALIGPLCALAWRVPGSPVWIGTAWVVGEAVRDRVPFGGFPWGRLAFVQPADGAIAPVTRLAAVGGAPLVTFAVALAGGFLAAGVLTLLPVLRTRGTGRNAARRGAVLVAGAVVLLGLGWLVPVPSNGEIDPRGASPASATVAAVQGNVPREGLDWMGQRRAVTRNHLLRTQELAADVAAGRKPAPDLVLWPENSSDLDPFLDQETAAVLSEASRSIDRPLLVGAVLRGPGEGFVRNAGLVWGPDGYLGSMYVKQHPVPFGEYLPGRAILERLVGRFAESLPNDFLPGKSPGLLSISGPGGSYRIGDVICFEVAYDGLVREVVDEEARLLVVQTNNASFGRGGETYQQMAMSRLRSIEHGRSTVVVATSGRSALIRPDGSVVDQSELYTPDVLTADLPLRSSRTLATRLGPVPEYLLVAFGLAVPSGYLLRRRRFLGTAPTSTGARRGAAPSDAEARDEAGSTA